MQSTTHPESSRRHLFCKPHNRISPALSSLPQHKVNKATEGQAEEREIASGTWFKMSRRDSSGRGGPMVTKLKEGLQGWSFVFTVRDS